MAKQRPPELSSELASVCLTRLADVDLYEARVESCVLAGQRGDSFHCHRSGPVHYFFNHLRWGRGCTVMSTA